MSPLGGLKITGNYLPRRYRLLLGAVFFIGSPLSAFAQSTDDQELAAIKAEMRMLESRLQAIEQRRHAGSASHAARPNTPKTSVARRVTLSRVPIKGEAPKIETARAATSPFSPASNIPRPGNRIMPVSTAGFVPDSITAGSAQAPSTPIVTPAHQTPPPLFQWLGNQHNEAHRTSIDLTSSSPLAITQTEVDHLPPVSRLAI